MKTLLLLLTLAALHAADPKPPAITTAEERLTLENYALRLTLIEAQIRELPRLKQDAIEGQQRAAMKICARAGVEMTSCQINSATGEITGKPEPVKVEVNK